MYNVYKAPNKVIVVSSFARKAVRGVAKCAPNDTFDEEKGLRLAMARCDAKVAEKRAVRAEKKYEEAIKLYHEAEAYLTKMERYYDDAQEDVVETQEHLEKVLAEM